MTRPDQPVPDEFDGEGPGAGPGPGADLGPGAASRNEGTESPVPVTPAEDAGGQVPGGQSPGDLPRGEH
jgi:hypothetical protein